MSYRLDRENLPAAREARPGIAVIGCPRDGGGLIRVRVSNFRRQRVRVECPRCPAGTIHQSYNAEGRALRDGEAPPPLAEIEPDAPATPDTPTPPAKPARRKVTDAAILAALSADEDRSAAVVAEALGYANTAPLTSRIRRMNAATGPLVEIRRDGRRVLLRLGEAAE